MYKTFAYYYDQLMDKRLYQKWLAFTQRQVGSLADQKVLDLACGSGDLLISYQKVQAQAFGIDLSEEMLTLAAAKLAHRDPKVTLLQADMRELDQLSLPAFDVVTCYADSLCYLPDLESLTQTFQAVRHCLKPDGTFLFDVHSCYQMSTVYPGYMYNYQTSDWAFLWSSFATQVQNQVEHDLTFFVWDEQKQAYDALQETQIERTYPLTTIKQALKYAGFQTIDVYGGFENEALHERTRRWFFKLR